MPKLPKTIMHWDDERDAGNPIMITLAKGFAFHDGGPGAHYTSACHVRGFATVADAIRGTAKKRLQFCDCQRCTNSL